MEGGIYDSGRVIQTNSDVLWINKLICVIRQKYGQTLKLGLGQR